MSYRLKASETVADGIGRIAREEVEEACATASDPRPDAIDKRVHNARTHCKKLRGLLRLVRPNLGDVYSRENAFVRDAARRLAGARDATVIRRAFNEIAKSDRSSQESFDAVRPALWERLGEIEGSGDERARLAEFAAPMRELLVRIDDWPAIGSNRFRTLEAGLGETFRRGRLALQTALDSDSDEKWHDWRKHVKYHWYHVRLLRNIWKPAMEARASELRRLSELVGNDHDLAVLRAALGDLAGVDGGQVTSLFELIDRRKASLRSDAGPLGSRIYAEKPAAFVKRMRCYWKAWRGKSGSPTGD